MNDNKKEGCGKVKKARETLINREICHPKALLDVTSFLARVQNKAKQWSHFISRWLRNYKVLSHLKKKQQWQHWETANFSTVHDVCAWAFVYCARSHTVSSSSVNFKSKNLHHIQPWSLDPITTAIWRGSPNYVTGEGEKKAMQL